MPNLITKKDSISDIDISDDFIGIMLVFIMVGLFIFALINGHSLISEGFIVPFIYSKKIGILKMEKRRKAHR